MPKSRILIVDDEIPVCQSIAAALENEYRVETALSGEEGLRLALEKSFDVLILDIMMPGMSGMDLLKILNKKRPGTQIIMITGYPSTRSAVQSIKDGAFDYIPKPFTPMELRSLVSRALTRKRIMTHHQEHNQILETPPSDYYSIPNHAWARILPSGAAKIGIHPLFLKTLSRIQKVEFPALNEILHQGNACLQIHDPQGKIHRLWSPLSGRVLEINPAAGKNLQPVRSDPYGKGWILILDPLHLQEELSFLSLSP